MVRRDAVWEACFAALSAVPRLLRLVLQSLRVCDLCESELPLLAQILSLLLQHTQLRNHMAANSALLQTIIQDLTVKHRLMPTCCFKYTPFQMFCWNNTMSWEVMGQTNVHTPTHTHVYKLVVGID